MTIRFEYVNKLVNEQFDISNHLMDDFYPTQNSERCGIMYTCVICNKRALVTGFWKITLMGTFDMSVLKHSITR